MYEFEVKNLSCGHCVATVTQAIQARDPKARVQVDLRTQRVRVDTDAAEHVLRAALEQAGYPTR